MALIIFRKGYDKQLDAYWKKSVSRLESPAITVADLSKSFIRMRMKKEGDLYFIYAYPALPPVFLLPLIPMAGMAILGVTSWLAYSIPAIVFFGLGFFWTPYPYLWAFKIGFYKEYKDFPDISTVKVKDAVLNLLWAK